MSLDRIVSLASLLVEQRDRVLRLKDELAEAKAAMLRTEREDLPELMAEFGLAEFKLSDGTLIKITEDVDARITDARRDEALRWLIDNGFGGLIKTSVAVTFGRGERDSAAALAERLDENYDTAHLEESVHPSTLKAFVREQLRDGNPVPFDLFSVYPYSKAIVK